MTPHLLLAFVALVFGLLGEPVNPSCPLDPAPAREPEHGDHDEH
jgi:hypothetical protein